MSGLDNDSSTPPHVINRQCGGCSQYVHPDSGEMHLGTWYHPPCLPQRAASVEVVALRADAVTLREQLADTQRQNTALRAELDETTRERDHAYGQIVSVEAEVERMRPIVDACCEWRDIALAHTAGADPEPVLRAGHAVRLSVDAYRATNTQETTDACERCSGIGLSETPHSGLPLSMFACSCSIGRDVATRSDEARRA